MSTRLERSITDRRLSGVCGGIGEYLQVDSNLVRVFFVVATIFTGGLFFLVYAACILIMPLPDRTDASLASAPSTGATPSDAAAPTTPLARPVDPEAAQRRRAMIGYFLIALGAVFLLGNVGLFRIVRWDLVWPLVLVGIGVLLLTERARR